MEESTMALGRRKSVQQQVLFITAEDLPRSTGMCSMRSSIGLLRKLAWIPGSSNSALPTKVENAVALVFRQAFTFECFW